MMPTFDGVQAGPKESYASGATRHDRTGKGRYDLLSPFVLERDAKHLENGTLAGYAERNWEKGIPFSRCIDSALRHITQWLQGDRTEDHLAAARWNLGCIIHFEEKIAQDCLPATLCDLPGLVDRDTA